MRDAFLVIAVSENISTSVGVPLEKETKLSCLLPNSAG